MRRLALSLAVVLALSLLLGGAWIQHWWESPLDIPQSGSVVYIEPGESFGSLTRRMTAEGVVDRPQLFKLMARITGADQRVRSGEYALPPGSSARTLLALLQSDATIRYQVTLPEGITLARAVQLLHEAPALAATLTGADDPRLLQLVAPHASADGFFLPETYQYQRGDTDLDVLLQAHQAMREVLERLWHERAIGLPLEDSYSALILASIIERETGAPQERGEIAGVFQRRLERGMRLQTDPTVIYGLGPLFDGNLTRAHLRDDSNPYNTYRHPGLPPGPICLPGAAALQAAVNPAPGNSLYFVAKGDGSHVFSETLEDHEAAVRSFQLRRRADYRSSPKRSQQ